MTTSLVRRIIVRYPDLRELRPREMVSEPLPSSQASRKKAA